MESKDRRTYGLCEVVQVAEAKYSNLISNPAVRFVWWTPVGIEPTNHKTGRSQDIQEQFWGDKRVAAVSFGNIDVVRPRDNMRKDMAATPRVFVHSVLRDQ